MLRRLLAVLLLGALPAPHVAAMAPRGDSEADHACGCSEGVCRCSQRHADPQGPSCHESAPKAQFHCHHPRPEGTLAATMVGLIPFAATPVRVPTAAPGSPVAAPGPEDGFRRADSPPPKQHSHLL